MAQFERKTSSVSFLGGLQNHTNVPMLMDTFVCSVRLRVLSRVMCQICTCCRSVLQAESHQTWAQLRAWQICMLLQQ